MNARAQATREDLTRIEVSLPLPMDVASTVMSAIGAAYPSAVIKAEGPWSPLVLLIDPKDRARNFKRKAAAARVQAEDPDLEPNLTAVNNNGEDGWSVSMAPPEELRLHLAEVMHHIVEAEAGPNYIEWEVRDPAKGTSYVLCVARSPEQTPHKLRQAAEARVAELEAEVARMREQHEEDLRRARVGRARKW